MAEIVSCVKKITFIILFKVLLESGYDKTLYSEYFEEPLRVYMANKYLQKRATIIQAPLSTYATEVSIYI